MNCVSALMKMGYDLRGYCPDTYHFLYSNDVRSEDGCVSLLWWLESRYG